MGSQLQVAFIFIIQWSVLGISSLYLMFGVLLSPAGAERESHISNFVRALVPLYCTIVGMMRWTRMELEIWFV